MRTKEKQATIYDIAAKANVSATTVSRVLNNKGYVAKEKRDEILSISQELKYTPNLGARMLKNKKTNQIMLSIPDMRNSFYNDLIDSVSKRAEENKYSLLLNYNQMNEKTKHKMLDNLAENHFDGLILISVQIHDKLIQKINSVNKPTVLMSISSVPPIQWKGKYDFVGVDTCEAMYMATKHLIDNGHKNIAYIGLDETSITGKERYEGYAMALKQRGIAVQKEHVFKGGYSESFGYESTLELLKSNVSPTAICACNDVLAIGIYKALEEKGILIPKDIAVVGMDDSDVCRILRPKLSSVSLCSSEMGDAAARLIFKRLQDNERTYENALFEPKLSVRDSSNLSISN